MTEAELRNAIDTEVSLALGKETSLLSEARSAALDLYLGKPLGNEVPGRSAIVSRDAMETVEWALPSMLRVFAQREVMSFIPTGPEDEDLALQEALYVNHTVMQDNPGFVIFYTWFKDAFISKNGYVKAYWQEMTEVETVEYTGQTVEQLQKILEDIEGEYEIIGQEERTEKTELGPIQVYDVQIKCTHERGKIVIENLPPEEVVVGKRTKMRLCDTDFVGHLINPTRADLVAMGFSRDLVKTITAYNWEHGDEANARNTVEQDNNTWQDDDAVDFWSQEIRLLEAYIRIDFDRDGIAELRRVIVSGDGILLNEETDQIPIYSITPIPMPHRHVGLSLIDTIADLAIYKTQLMRQLLDNAYLSNNKRIFYDRNAVNISDLMVNRPGAHVRVNGNPSSAVFSLEPTPIIRNVAPVIDYLDTVKASRIGIDRMTSGLDPDVLQNATKGAIDVATNKAAERIETIARIFAETGVKELFLGVHRLLRQHQNWKRQIKLKNNWIPIDPTEWKSRTDLVVNAGLGNNTRDEVRQNLALMAQAQIQAAQAGIILPKNVYNLFFRMQRELGFETAGFATDPESPEFKQHQQSQQAPPDPLLEAQKMKSQVDQMKLQLEAEQSKAKLQLDAQARELEMLKVRLDKEEKDRRFNLDLAEIELKYSADLAKAGMGAELEQERDMRNREDAERNAQREDAKQASQAEKPAGNDGSMELVKAMAQALAGPKQVIRDETGRVVGIQPQAQSSSNQGA